MKRLQKVLGSLAVVAASLFVVTPAKASTDTVHIDIRVSITATKSLAAGTTSYDFGAMNVNASSVSATAINIQNDSGGLVETYTMQGADASSLGAGSPWTLAGSPGSDTYALAAEFSTARPADADGNWGSDNLTKASATDCDDTTFGNGTHAEAGDGVSSLAGQYDRSLWFRLKTPTAVSDTTQHLAQVTLAVK